MGWLGLAQAVYGESALEEDLVPEESPLPEEPTVTVAVDLAALPED